MRAHVMTVEHCSVVYGCSLHTIKITDISMCKALSKQLMSSISLFAAALPIAFAPTVSRFFSRLCYVSFPAQHHHRTTMRASQMKQNVGDFEFVSTLHCVSQGFLHSTAIALFRRLPLLLLLYSSSSSDRVSTISLRLPALALMSVVQSSTSKREIEFHVKLMISSS